MPGILHLDFETQSAVDLTKVGADVYARHPSTRVMAAGFAFNDGPVLVREINEPPPLSIITHIKEGGLLYAWNAPFEWLIWNFSWKRQFPQLPELPIRQVRCVMAKSYAMGLPGKLEKAAPALGLDDEKDMKGWRIMMQLSQPKDFDPNGRPIFYCPIQHEEKFTRMYSYCGQDVEVERKADKRILNLCETEQELWFLDHEINQRGVMVDLKAAKASLEIVELEQKRLNEEIRNVTGNQVATTNAHAQLSAWLRSRGIDVTGVAKSDVSDLLEKQTLPSDCRRALEIRREASKSSTKKFSALIERTSSDKRLRSTLQYHGATTGRWAARGFQLHNLPRPKLTEKEIEGVFDVLSK